MIVIDASEISKVYQLNKPVIRKLKDLLPTLLRSFSNNVRWRRPAGTNDFWALKDISFRQEAGEVLGLYGRNGAGKSTLLKILSRVTEPTSGKILVTGRVGSLLEIGIGFHGDLTGRDNIYLSGAILGMRRSEIKRHFDEIVSFAQIENFIDTPVKRYSSGMHVRLAFAVAANLEQEILLIDEVLAVGDLAFQRQCLDKLRSFAKSGRTVLFVSHNVMSMRELCTTALHLKNGLLVGHGTATEVCNQYLQDISSSSPDEIDRMRNLAFRTSKLHKAQQTSTVKFEEIDLLSQLGVAIAYGEPLSYDIKISSLEDVEQIQVGLSILDHMDNCVGTSYYNEFFSIGAGQSINLRMTVADLKLSPGLYSTRFVIGGGNLQSRSHELDMVLLKPGFEVVVSDGNGPILWKPEQGPYVLDNIAVETIQAHQSH